MNNNNKDYTAFKNDLGQRESSGNYSTTNKTNGAVGKYQFIKARLADFGISNSEAFRNNPELQETIFFKHCQDITNYIFKKLLSGLIGGAHLGGKGGLKQYLLYGTNPKDALGTSIRDYVQKFSDYDLTDFVQKTIAKDELDKIEKQKKQIKFLEGRITSLKENKKELLSNNMNLIKRIIENLKEKILRKGGGKNGD